MKKNTARQPKGTAAFTLMELLTVIGISGVLTVILLPVFFAARENGRKTVCVSNLKQIGQAFSSYVSDYDGSFPGAVVGSTRGKHRLLWGEVWTRSLLPYTGHAFLVCPDRDLPGEFVKLARESNGREGDTITGYAMNYRLSEELPLIAKNKVTLRITGRAETLFRYPALTFLVFDARTGLATMNYPDVYPWRKAWLPEARAKWDSLIPQKWQLAEFGEEIRAQKGGAQRHSGGANYVFADGHVKWLKPEQISPSPQSDGVHPGFGL